MSKLLSTPSSRTALDQLCVAGLVASLMFTPLAGAVDGGNTIVGADPLQARQIWIQNRFTGDSRLETIPAPNTSLWNQARIGHYLDSLTVETRPPMGVLVINRIGLEVPVYNGTGETELNLGAGRVPGTGLFYGEGNLAISGHRDGYFRGLKDLEIGDRITLRGLNGDEEFTVNQFSKVHKTDHEALISSENRMLTLVTCYPFYHVGHAPERYLIQAVPTSPVLGSSD